MAHGPKLIPLLSLAFALSIAAPALAQTKTVADLAGNTHIHGLAFDRAEPSKILIATHHGLLVAGSDGTLTEVSESQDDFMGFTPHPADPAILFASGHPKGGGNLGFIKSTDAGKSWTQISPGVNGPVDFHQLAVSPTNPDVLYGSFGSIQTSSDGGATWTIAGEAPPKLIDLAISPANPAVVYAATQTGLMISRDGAKNWDVLITDVPVTTVELTADGTIYAFVPGRGLLKATENAPKFETIGQGPDSAGYLLHLAVNAKSPERLVAVTGELAVVVSGDSGATWTNLGAN